MAELLIKNEQSKVELTDAILDALQRVCDRALSYEECDFDAEISITFTDNENIKVLNGEYRAVDKPTDVLSFPMYEFDEDGNLCCYEDETDEGVIMLGDIVISAERAAEQAEEYGHSLVREIAFLTAHSMLHLLGYDHVDDEEGEKIMQHKQNEILDSLGIKRE